MNREMLQVALFKIIKMRDLVEFLADRIWCESFEFFR